MTEVIQPAYGKVMVVDDNNVDLYITSRIISKCNFSKNVIEYILPQEALQYLMENQENIDALPQVIFIDIYMPPITGFEFLEEYDKLSDALKNYCKVFILSATTDKQDITLARNNKNVIDFQEKPITKEFLTRISNLSSVLTDL